VKIAANIAIVPFFAANSKFHPQVCQDFYPGQAGAEGKRGKKAAIFVA
jgi:hypothetical protein